jgi:HAD superfamily hydrolase (TIGR01509 family)
VQRPPTDHEIIRTFGPPERANLRMLLGDPAIGRPQALEHLEEAERRFHEYYEGRHGNVRAFPGIAEAIALALQKGWRLAVFTGKSRRSAIFALKDFNLLDQVECLVSGTDVKEPKPHPEGVLQIAKTLGIPTERLLLVGDSPGDIQAGKAAGTKTAAALWGAFEPAKTRQAGADWLLVKVQDLIELLQNGAGCC